MNRNACGFPHRRCFRKTYSIYRGLELQRAKLRFFSAYRDLRGIPLALSRWWGTWKQTNRAAADGPNGLTAAPMCRTSPKKIACRNRPG